jgi:hypothetical protein
VEWLIKFRAEDRAESRTAAASLRKAIVETELLFRFKRKGLEASHEARATAARLWMDASTEFRTVNRGVSDGCYEISLNVAQSLEFTEAERIEFDEKFAKVIQEGVMMIVV